MQRFVFNILTTLIGLTFIFRLGYLQIIKYDKSKQMMDNLAIKVEKTGQTPAEKSLPDNFLPHDCGMNMKDN